MHFLDPEYWITTFGTAGLVLVIFLESGLLPAPLPGDSLLFIAGVFASAGKYGMNIWVIAIACFIAAVLGSQIGYYIGLKWGTKLFKPDAKFFKQKYADKSHEFYERQGPKAVVLARFIPFVRTIAPILAGVSRMKQRTFFIYNLVGAALWAVGISVAGYFLGDAIGKENVDRYLLPIVAVIIILSFIPPFLEWRKHKRQQAEAVAADRSATVATDAGAGSPD